LEYVKSLQVEGEAYQNEDWETNSESDFSEDEDSCGFFFMPEKVVEMQL